MNTLIFVYNADSGFFNMLTDAVHKTLSPSTYQCSLCQLSYGGVKIKKPWREYLKQLPFNKEFLHRNEFREQYPDCQDAQLPAIFIKTESSCIQLVSAEEINHQQTLTQLIALLESKIKSIKK